MYLLHYLYFIIITSFGIKFLFQRTGKVRHPLNKEQMLSFDGPELFWTLTFSTGLLAFSAPGVLDLMAIRLLVLERLVCGEAEATLECSKYFLFTLYRLAVDRAFLFSCSYVWFPSNSKIPVSVVHYAVCFGCGT